jgi:hypothetical protein
MTPVEDRVRRTLADLAPVVPADGTARLGVARAMGRRRRRGRAGGALGTALVTAALVAAALAGPRALGRDRAVVPASHGERVAFAGVGFDLPPGWVVAEHRGNETMCVEPAEDPYPSWDCSGLRIDHGDLPGYELGDYVDHGPWNWSHATDVTPCPTGTDPDDAVLPPDGGDYFPVEQDIRPVGDHTAVYDRWAAECRLSGFRFTPQAWHLPVSQMVIYDYFDRPETAGILASFTFL